jgi:hypothetical protein
LSCNRDLQAFPETFDLLQPFVMHFSVIVASAIFAARAMAVGVIGSPEGFVSAFHPHVSIVRQSDCHL